MFRRGEPQPDQLAIKLHATMDGEVWADEFMRVYGHRLGDVDRYVMLTWFANALETGRAHGSEKDSHR